MKRFIRWMLLIIWMLIIFVFSNQPGDVSSEQSRLVIYVFNLLGIHLNTTLGEMSTFIVRKVAHFSEYFILGILTYNAIKDNIMLGNSFIICILVVFVYACTDEFHQSFIPGRGPSFRDVMIDTSGGLTASVILYFNHRRKIKKIR